MLEEPLTLHRAQAIVESFSTDRVTYPHRDVHSRKGVCKILIEEFCPLVRLAEEFQHVDHIRLLPEAHQGPDGEIGLRDREPLQVQITCSSQSRDRALQREQLRDGKITFTHQHHDRDKSTKRVVATGRASTTPAADVQSRVTRIMGAIEAKEEKFYAGTDILLVLDDSSNFKHLEGLHEAVCEEIRPRPRSHYRQIYVSYGNDLKQVSSAPDDLSQANLE
ncbi:MAG: hypothetical protein DRI90_15665 [Deltaproteobacteria bacterium]|nr:MAG: hypothetical protein DRI90_15665 [Deltaproteobacteria bacterium]